MTSARHVWLCLGLAALAMGVATLGGAGVFADGSYWLFVALDSQQVHAFHGRYSNLLFQWPVVLASKVTENPFTLQTLFGIPYAAIPVLALGASWWVVRRNAPHLFIWPALGIGLATLPGQFCLVCEGQIVVNLFWPVLLTLLVGISRGRAIVAAAFAVLMLFFHPLAALLFGIGALSALATAIFRKERRLGMSVWAGALVLLAALAVIRTGLVASSHDASHLSLQVWRAEFQEGVAGLPLVAVMLAWLAGLLLLLSRLPRFQEIRRRLERSAALSILGGGVLLGVWALDPELWRRAVGFRNFAAFAAAPIMLFAVIDALSSRQGSSSFAPIRYRRPGALIALLVFTTVLSMQGLVFHNLSQAALAELKGKEQPCVDHSSMNTTKETPLDGWAFTTHALVMQGRTPQALVLDAPWCLEAAGSGAVKLVSWEYYRGDGWFNVASARSRIQFSEPCVFFLSAGWQPVERYSWGWWAWSNGDGVVRVISKQAATVQLTGFLTSKPLPNWVDVLVNGALTQTVALGAGEEEGRSIAPITVQLRAGENVVEVRSHVSVAPEQADPRHMVLAISDMRLEAPGLGLQCTMKTGLV